jgi:hypothetical protein
MIQRSIKLFAAFTALSVACGYALAATPAGITIFMI